MIELLNIDCMEYMATLPDKAFDLAVVDPPYGVGNFSQSDAIHRVVTWNNHIPKKEYFEELKRISKKRIIWGANYYNCFENGNGAIVWWKNVGHPSMSQCEIASVSGQQKIDFFHKNWSGGVRPTKSIHPCQKPIALYDWILRNYAKPGQRILDTHLGSGSSAIAAHYFGCDFVGCEIDIDYFNAAKERFDRETRQVAMF